MEPKKLAHSRARIALIDADSVLYAVALSAEVLAHGSDEYLQVKDGEQCYREVVAKLEALVEAVGASDALICLTPTGVKQFRSVLLPSYKQNRSVRRPIFLQPLQHMLQARKPFGCLAVRGLEADDVCGISSGNLQKAGLREPVIVSIDKDLRSIPGLLYSWLKRDTGVEEITESQADYAHLYQTLVGDAVDNYTGLPGFGPKKAAKVLEELAHASEWARWEWIVGLFKKKGLNAEYALTQARVARILRSTDWDTKTKEVRLWLPTNSTTDHSLPSLTAPAFPKTGAMYASTTLRLADILPSHSETMH